MLLQHFWLGLSKKSALQLDISAGGLFTHKTTAEGEALLDCILENTSFTETREKRPPVPKDPVTPPDKGSLQEAVKGVTTIMNSEWVHEGEMSTEAIRLQPPCFI